MDNEEPQLTQISNAQLAHAGHKLPEQSKVALCDMPRASTVDNIIKQWQPMGIRVRVNSPFIGNDNDFLFAIRNGPFIPYLNGGIADSSPTVTTLADDSTPDYSTRNFANGDNIESYVKNNLRNVTHASSLLQNLPDNQSAVHITYYDQPPSFSSFSTMFRRWRGTIHYRVRIVSGFTTQGYVFCSIIKNSPAIPKVYDQFGITQGPCRQDISYREAMQNSYVMGDTAMFRHFEVQVPYEYPTPYYDQLQWIAKRCRPAQLFSRVVKKSDPKIVTQVSSVRNFQFEPHGDNFIVFGLRGDLITGIGSYTPITFELEYRAGDDFQFADPFLPFYRCVFSPLQQISQENPNYITTIPNARYTSDGIGMPVPRTTATAARALSRRTRTKKEAGEDPGEDTVDDDAKSTISNTEFRNLRKSQRILDLQELERTLAESTHLEPSQASSAAMERVRSWLPK